MEYLKVAEGRGSPKRGQFRVSRSRIHSNLIEDIAKLNGGSVVSQNKDQEGVVRVKIVVRKQDLKQMLQVMKGTDHGAQQQAPLCVEQRLNLLRRKQMLRAAKESRRSKGSWSPALQSIPEDF